jgi:hypothetical protein
MYQERQIIIVVIYFFILMANSVAWSMQSQMAGLTGMSVDGNGCGLTSDTVPVFIRRD